MTNPRPPNTPDPAASRGAPSPGTVEAARLIGAFLGEADDDGRVPSSLTDGVELIIQRHAVERVLDEMAGISAEWERQVDLVLDRAERAEGALVDFGAHQGDCLLAHCEAGEPTPSGGYRYMFRGKWYDKPPPCKCGLAAALEASKPPEEKR